MLLQSMSLDPSDCGWTVGVHGFEPVPSLDPMAPEELLRFTSCNCKGYCSNRQCSCKKNGIQCIAACKKLHAESPFSPMQKKTLTRTIALWNTNIS